MPDEERYEADARDWLDSVDVPPPCLDVTTLVRAGRVQVRRRRLAGTGGAAVALAVAVAVPVAVRAWPEQTGGSAAAAQPDCAATALPVQAEALATGAGGSTGDDDPTVVDVAVAGMDATGRFVVGSAQVWEDLGSEGRAGGGETTGMVLWDDGSATFIPNPPGLNLEATDVNSAGVIVGNDVVGVTHRGSVPDASPADATADGGVDVSSAWIYRDGEVTELPAPAGYSRARAQSINSAGDVVGTAEDGQDRTVAVAWPAARLDSPVVLRRPNPTGASVRTVTDNGLVVGAALSWAPYGGSEMRWTSVPYVWTDAEAGRELALPADIFSTDITSAAGDWAVGLAWRQAAGGEVAVPMRWDLRTGAVAALDTGDPSLQRAEAVSATGDVVMVAWDLSAIALLRDGHAYPLPEPVVPEAAGGPDPAGSLDFREAAINDSGTVIASTATVHGAFDQIPVMWRC